MSTKEPQEGEVAGWDGVDCGWMGMTDDELRIQNAILIKIIYRDGRLGCGFVSCF